MLKIYGEEIIVIQITYKEIEVLLRSKNAELEKCELQISKSRKAIEQQNLRTWKSIENQKLRSGKVTEHQIL